MGILSKVASATMDRTVWTTDETHTLIDFIKEKSGHKILDSKRQRNIELFKAISDEMKARGFIKTAEQCRSKFKTMKSNYLTAKAKASRSG